MASVLSFAPRAGAGVDKRPPAGLTASIIIFPGVRYERLDAEPDEDHPTRAAKPLPRHS